MTDRQGVGCAHWHPRFYCDNMLFADDLSLPSNEHTDSQTMLNKLRVYAERKSEYRG